MSREVRYEQTSILELGAKGILDGVPFTLAGRRVIRGHRGGLWNDWTLDGIEHVTLAENAGSFMVYREGQLVTDVGQLEVGMPPPWIVVERGTASSVAEFGAVPRMPPSWTYADLSEWKTGRRATVSGGSTFVGTRVDPNGLGLTIRREPPALVPTPNVALPNGVQLWLDVGDKGVLDGAEWQVIGIVARKTETAQWEEYCVYSAGVGLRWLVVSDGNWLYVSPVELGMLERPQPLGAARATIERLVDAEFEQPQVTWAAGELPWAVDIGETVMSIEVGDHVGEYGPSDITWSRQQPIATDDIARAFNKRAMPKPR